MNRLASLRQRLHRGADAFEFNALIEGVSTLDEPLDENREAEEIGRGGEGERGRSESLPVESSTLNPQPSTLNREERLRTALDSLTSRLLREVGKMRVALLMGDVEEAGFSLAHVNQILELLHSIDPTGDLARQLEIAGAPPEGRAWPSTAWSVVEFAESPLSALLPPDADETFVRGLLYAAWGVTFERPEVD